MAFGWFSQPSSPRFSRRTAHRPVVASKTSPPAAVAAVPTSPLVRDQSFHPAARRRAAAAAPPPRPVLDADAAAARIQSAWRGHSLRQSKPLQVARAIAEVRKGACDMERSLDGDDAFVASVCGDPMERLRANETVMGLLFRLDALSTPNEDVRALRRDVARRLTKLLERLDALPQVQQGAKANQQTTKDAAGTNDAMKEENARETGSHPQSPQQQKHLKNQGKAGHKRPQPTREGDVYGQRRILQGVSSPSACGFTSQPPAAMWHHVPLEGQRAHCRPSATRFSHGWAPMGW
eukprot:TRINITY_DN78862_c0_g1_i1.p1 TRINITY_DN78862_c0_g1~~TRINITY_DN78862_c0_g1_i1.p1  ORF type:complete len:293 (+),score=-11.00 TRINITY_DN78862_c0_g1_i1:219-1097(+)